MTAPYAVCHVDGEPLVGTFEFPGVEWICVVCERTYTYFSPGKAAETPALKARYEALKADYDAARRARVEAPGGAR